MSHFNEELTKLFTLIFVKDKVKNRVLLGMKKRGFGVGKWNGFGGKVEPGESVKEGAVRELKEECGLIVKIDELNHLGYVLFRGSNPDRKVHIFTTEYNDLEVIESDEMLPKWFNFNNIPYDEMWGDAVYWMKYVLTDTKFGYFSNFSTNFTK